MTGADATGKMADGTKHTASLEHAVKFARYPTCAVRDYKNVGLPESRDARKDAGHAQPLAEIAQMAGWATDSHTGGKDLDGMALTALGLTTELFHAPTGRPEGARANRPCLNPFFSLWLMGFPLSWAIAGLLIPKKSRRK